MSASCAVGHRESRQNHGRAGPSAEGVAREPAVADRALCDRFPQFDGSGIDGADSETGAGKRLHALHCAICVSGIVRNSVQRVRHLLCHRPQTVPRWDTCVRRESEHLPFGAMCVRVAGHVDADPDSELDFRSIHVLFCAFVAGESAYSRFNRRIEKFIQNSETITSADHLLLIFFSLTRRAGCS